MTYILTFALLASLGVSLVKCDDRTMPNQPRSELVR